MGCLIAILSCLLFLFFERMPHQIEIGAIESVTPQIISTTPFIIPTKWWIKAIPTFSSSHSKDTTPFQPAELFENSCAPAISSSLRPGIFAYVSSTPPLPNRIRAGAGQEYSYLGQIESGEGVKILDGPICTDGYAWWLVDAKQNELRGWMAEGSGFQHWIVPCPNPNMACEKPPVTPKSTPTAAFTLAEENVNKRCNTHTFAIGMFGQVTEDNLLVVRSEPYTGIVIGRVEPMSTVKILDGPACAGNAIWWKVHLAALNLTGWANEANLRACTKENNCT